MALGSSWEVENDFDPFFTPKMHKKWNTPDIADGADGADGATETTPPAAPQSIVLHASGASIT